MWCHPETIHRQQSVGRIDFGRCKKCEAMGTDGRWQRETPYKEELELLRHCTDMRCEVYWCAKLTMQGESGDWANSLDIYLANGRLNAWTSVRVRACCIEVEQDYEDREESPRWSKAEADGRGTVVEAWRHTDVAETGVTQNAASGLVAAKRRDHFGQVQELPPKRRAVIRVQSSQTQDYVSAHRRVALNKGWRRKLRKKWRTELHLECSQRAALGSAEHRATSSSKLRQSWQKKDEQLVRLTCASSVTMQGGWIKVSDKWRPQSGGKWLSRRLFEEVTDMFVLFFDWLN